MIRVNAMIVFTLNVLFFLKVDGVKVSTAQETLSSGSKHSQIWKCR